MSDKDVVITIKVRDDAQKSLAQAIGNIDGMATSTSKLTAGFGMAATAMGGLVAGVAIKELSTDIFQAGMKAESMQNTFKAVTGSLEGMRNELSFVRSEANRMGLDFYKSADAYKSILASAKGTSMQGQEVRDLFTAVSEASTVLGLSADDTGGILKALEQMMSKGKIQAEELRGQLGERLPGAFRIMANAMGVSTAELDKMLQSGTVMSDKVLPAFAKALHEQYRGSVADAANSSRAAINRLSTAWEDLKVKLAQSPAGGLMAGGVEVVSSLTQRVTDAIDRSGREWGRLKQDIFNPAEFMDAFVTSLTLRGDALRTQVRRMETELNKIQSQRNTWKEIMDFKAVEPWSEMQSRSRTILPNQTDIDSSAAKLQGLRKQVVELTESYKNLYGLSNENKDKIADVDTNIKLTQQKGLEGSIADLLKKQAEEAEKIKEIRSRPPEWVEWITTTSRGTGQPHEVDQSYFKPPDLTGLADAEAEYSRLGFAIQEAQRQQKEMNNAVRQMADKKVTDLISELNQKMSEQGKSAFADKEFQDDVVKLVQERQKSETDVNSLLLRRKEIEISMGNQSLSGQEWAGLRDQLVAVNEEIVQAQAKSQQIKSSLAEIEKERTKYLQGDQQDLQTKIQGAKDQLDQFMKLAKNLNLKIDTSEAEESLNRIDDALYKFYQAAPQIPAPDMTLFDQATGKFKTFLQEMPSRLDLFLDFKSTDGMQIPEKFLQVNQNYTQLADLVRQGATLSLDTSQAESKISGLAERVRQIQSFLSGGANFTVDAYWAMSPPLPMTEGINKFMGMLNMIPKGMTFTVQTLMSGGMSGSNALSVYDAMAEFNKLKSQRDLWSMQANPMVSDQAKGWVGMNFFTKQYMIDFAKDMLAKTQDAYTRQAIQFESTMNGIYGQQSRSPSSGSSGSSGRSSAAAGSTTQEVAINFTGPWQFNIGAGPARDMAISIADIVENTMVSRIENGRSKLLNALVKAKKITRN